MNRIEFLANLDKYKGEDHSAFLQHYGILGQKWGQRRWQNADGTFNTEGKIRYFGSQKAQAKKMQDEKIGGLWSDMTARTFFNITTEGKANHIKKHPDYFDIDGLTDDEITKVVRMTPSRYNPYDTEAYADRINRNLHNYKVNKEIKEFAESRKDTSKLEDKVGAKYNESDINKQEKEIGKIQDVPEKLKSEAKKIREDGSKELADNYEKTAKDIDEKIKGGYPKGSTKEEKKEIRKACNQTAKTARKCIPFGLRIWLGALPTVLISWNITNKAIKELGYTSEQKKNGFTASDWKRVNQKIMEMHPNKFAKELTELDTQAKMEDLAKLIQE